MTWFTCVLDNDYEICDEYPYNIRKKSNGKVIVERINDKGYYCCYMNAKQYKKHRIVASQFIENDDPDNKTMVDHINHNRADNHISNLRWVIRADNVRNMATLQGEEVNILDELPETAEQLESYGSHWFDGLYIDYEERKLYLHNGVNYRELIPRSSHGSTVYYCYDLQKKRVQLYHSLLFD